MKEITLKIITDLETVDPEFLLNLENLTGQHGYRITENQLSDDDFIPRKRRLSHDEFVRLSEEISRRIGPVKSTCAEYIREMRDRQ